MIFIIGNSVNFNNDIICTFVNFIIIFFYNVHKIAHQLLTIMEAVILEKIFFI